MKEFLLKFNLDLSKFGEGDAKTLEDIAQEMSRGESSLMEAQGCVIRTADVVLLRLTDSETGKTLIEARNKWGDGRVRVED